MQMRSHLLFGSPILPVNGIQAHPQMTFDYSEQIDLELFTFVERYATNLARWDVLVHFAQNPGLSDHADGIAKSIGRLSVSIQKELDDLAYLGVLRTRPNGKRKLYELTRVPRLRRAVLRLAQQSEDAASGK